MRKQHWHDLRDSDVLKRIEADKDGRRIAPKTPGQARYVEAVRTHTVTLCAGPPGTGKTLLALSVAAEGLRTGLYKKIVVARPLVECAGKDKRPRLGMLPGGIAEKIAPYVAAARGCMLKLFSPQDLVRYESSEVVQYLPLEVMRGLTFDQSFCILDESQNAERGELRMFLTRMGDGAKVVVNGDWYQSDITDGDEMPPLYDAMCDLKGLKDVALVQLTEKDIVRNPLIKEIEKRLR